MGPMINYRKIIYSYRQEQLQQSLHCSYVQHGCYAYKQDNKTEFQLKPTNQMRSRRLCDKPRVAAIFNNPHLQSDRSDVVHNCSAKIAVIV